MSTPDQINLMRSLEQKLIEQEAAFFRHYDAHMKSTRFTLKLGIRRGLNIFLEFLFYGWAFFGFIWWLLLSVSLLITLNQISQSENPTATEQAIRLVECMVEGPDTLFTLILADLFILFFVLSSLFTGILLTRYRRRRDAARSSGQRMDNLAKEVRIHFQQIHAIRQAIIQSFQKGPSSPPPSAP